MRGKQTHIKCETVSAIGMFYGIRIAFNEPENVFLTGRKREREGEGGLFDTFLCEVKRVTQEQRAIMWKTIFKMNFMYKLEYFHAFCTLNVSDNSAHQQIVFMTKQPTYKNVIAMHSNSRKYSLVTEY